MTIPGKFSLHLFLSGLIISSLIITGCQQKLIKISMKIESPNFINTQVIPAKYTCQGLNISPELNISDVPDDAKSLALIMEDPDAPSGVWTHWLVWNIDPSTKIISEDSIPNSAIQGNNTRSESKYTGPCPPNGAHRYFFKLFALKNKLNLPEGSTKAELLSAMTDQIIEEAQLMGTFRKSGDSQQFQD